MRQSERYRSAARLITGLCLSVALLVSSGCRDELFVIENEHFRVRAVRVNPMANEPFNTRVYVMDHGKHESDFRQVLWIERYDDVRGSFIGDSLLLLQLGSEQEQAPSRERVILRLPSDRAGSQILDPERDNSPFDDYNRLQCMVDSMTIWAVAACRIRDWDDLQMVHVVSQRASGGLYESTLLCPADSVLLAGFRSDTLKVLVYWSGFSTPQRFDVGLARSEGEAITYAPSGT